jgi:hypothetical protein
MYKFNRSDTASWMVENGDFSGNSDRNFLADFSVAFEGICTQIDCEHPSQDWKCWLENPFLTSDLSPILLYLNLLKKQL